MTDKSQGVKEAIDRIAKGDMIIVCDDEGRENEGDLLMAASQCTEQQMAFFIRYSSGILCTPMTKDWAQRLELPPMVRDNDSAYQTAFTISVDYKYDTSTGISAKDRVKTVRNLARFDSKAREFVRPGHIFPLIAAPHGTLSRPGHTEAAVDLCRLAGLAPVGLIGELVNDDGSVKKGKMISSFAHQHNIPIITIADIIEYRWRNQLLVELAGQKSVTAPWGRCVCYNFSLLGRPLEAKIIEVLANNSPNVSAADLKTSPWQIVVYYEDFCADVLFGSSQISAVAEYFRQSGNFIFIILPQQLFVTPDREGQGYEFLTDYPLLVGQLLKFWATNCPIDSFALSIFNVEDKDLAAWQNLPSFGVSFAMINFYNKYGDNWPINLKIA